MIQARVSDYMLMDGVAVMITDKREGGNRRVRRFHRDTNVVEWEEITDPAIGVEATMILSNDEARALLDALLRHYQGASDMHTVRSDLLHERARVDKLTDAVIEAALGRRS